MNYSFIETLKNDSGVAHSDLEGILSVATDYYQGLYNTKP